ncbi:prolyl oligopeptidase family serine peptidase [Acidothermaceae bacterium B102]|nr:prolyl oligopeptidase family serine peptidase [Acidothermaceae bacterium B102]
MNQPAYPAAAREDIVDDLFGHRVADPYRWLEDATTAQTAEWLGYQDDLARPYLDGLPGRERLRARLTELLGTGVISGPAWRGDRYFFVRRDPGQEHAAVLVREADGTERMLIDPAALDPSGKTTLDSWQPDKEGRLLAYQLSVGGDEESSLLVLDVDSGAVVDGPLPRTRYSPVAWLPGGEQFYYTRRLAPEDVPADESMYHHRVYLHRVGDSPDDDVMVFGEGMDKTSYYGVSVSRDGRWLSLTRTLGTAPRNDVWLADISAGNLTSPALQEVQLDIDAGTSIHVGNDGRLYVFTDRDAPRGRLCVTDPTTRSYDSWRELIAEDPEAVLDDFAILDDVLLVSHTRHAASELTVHDLVTGALLRTVELPGVGSLGGVGSRPEGGTEAWVGWTGFATPSCVLRYDAVADTLETWAEPPGRVEVPAVHSQVVTYPSKDGTLVRMFVVSPAGTPDQPRPTTLYGYGGFNIPMTPGFSAGILAWVEAGGVYAIACLRGGSEEGEDWHRAGRRDLKQNVFDDFAAAAEWLVAEGWTTSEQLAISGGSNGGLLVGAALTQRPELYAAVVCSAPLLDMVRYEGSGLGQLWSDEYGTASDPAELAWLLGYSPYHRVVEGTAYPAVLFTIFDSDSRVDPMHARKLCAALQWATSSDRPILLRREADVGHAGRSVSRSVELSVDSLSFAAARTGLVLGT